MESLTFLRPACIGDWLVSIGLSVFCTRKAQRRAQAFPITPRAPFGHDFSRSVLRVRFPSPNKGDCRRVSIVSLDNDPIKLETRSRDAIASVGPVYSPFFNHHFIYQHWSTRIKSALWPRYAYNHTTRAMAAMDQWTVKSLHQRPFI